LYQSPWFSYFDIPFFKMFLIFGWIKFNKSDFFILKSIHLIMESLYVCSVTKSVKLQNWISSKTAKNGDLEWIYLGVRLNPRPYHCLPPPSNKSKWHSLQSSVGSRSNFLWLGLGQPFTVWDWVGKMSPKTSNFFNSGPKESLQKVPGSKAGRPPIYCESKVSSGPSLLRRNGSVWPASGQPETGYDSLAASNSRIVIWSDKMKKYHICK